MLNQFSLAMNKDETKEKIKIALTDWQLIVMTSDMLLIECKWNIVNRELFDHTFRVTGGQVAQHKINS